MRIYCSLLVIIFLTKMYVSIGKTSFTTSFTADVSMYIRYEATHQIENRTMIKSTDDTDILFDKLILTVKENAIIKENKMAINSNIERPKIFSSRSMKNIGLKKAKIFNKNISICVFSNL